MSEAKNFIEELPPKSRNDTELDFKKAQTPQDNKL